MPSLYNPVAGGRSEGMLRFLPLWLGVLLLIPMLWMAPPGAAAGGIVAVVVFYTAMIPVRPAVRTLRVRLWAMATLMVLIAIAFFVSAGFVYAAQVNAG